MKSRKPSARHGEPLALTASRTGSSSGRREKIAIRSVTQPAVPVARGNRRSRHGLDHIGASSNRVVGLVRGCPGAGRHLTRGLVVGKQLDDGGLRDGDSGADRLGRVGRKANAAGLTEIFTRFELNARLAVPAGTDLQRARIALEKAEQNCLISNSLKGSIELRAEVVVASEARDTSVSSPYRDVTPLTFVEDR